MGIILQVLAGHLVTQTLAPLSRSLMILAALHRIRARHLSLEFILYESF